MSEKKEKSVVREYTEAIIVAVLLALFIRTFVVQAFKIPSGSMLPTLQIGDHLLVNKFAYGIYIPDKINLWRGIYIPIPFVDSPYCIFDLSDPDRGDVIVFRYPEERDTDYIKRVIGVSGDKIEIQDKVVYVNGKQMDDQHAHFSSEEVLARTSKQLNIFKRGPNKDNFGPILVPDGKLFVMGDNRDNSYDSRFWGYVDEDEVRGKAFMIYWSWEMKGSFMQRLTSIRFSRIGDIIH